MRRPLLLLQLIIGWLPIWALYTTLIVTAHPPTSVASAAMAGLGAILPAAALGLLVNRLTERVPWPSPLRLWFLALHAVAAILYAVAWLVTSSAVALVLHHGLVVILSPILVPFLVLGVWLYVMVAGVSYAAQGTERAARAEAGVARAQLAALRAQLHPHFLFNALHTVVQLIPREPGRAAEAAEQVAALLRTTIEEERDLVSLDEEWRFVERYLAIEHIRFGERLRVQVELSDEARLALVPSFALQTLVENAVRHGAAPRVDPTDVAISGTVGAGSLVLCVRDGGAGANPESLGATAGTGLVRLRERVGALYGSRGRLEIETAPDRGFAATLVIPHAVDEVRL